MINFITNEGVKPGTMIVMSPDAKVIVPFGKPLFEQVGPTIIEGERIDADHYRIRISANVRCNAVGFEGFTVVKFD